MKKIFFLIVVGVLLFSACEQEDTPKPEQQQENNKGCIFGKITKFYSGNITDAQIHLLDSTKIKIRSSSKVTDFRFPNLDGGIYHLMITKNEFATIYPEPIRVIPNGDCQQIDWQISKLPSSLCVITINNSIEIVPIDTLDYGENLNLQRFKIFNNTGSTITWSIRWSDVKKSCDWVSEITYEELSISDSGWNPNEKSISGVLGVEKTSEPIFIHIDRSKWHKDKNPALIPINGGGGWDLYIKARSE